MNDDSIIIILYLISFTLKWNSDFLTKVVVDFDPAYALGNPIMH